jgi:hypothetical protein
MGERKPAAAVSAVVANEAGKPMASLRTNVVTGARLYAATPEYQDTRKMITSLRPAGE